MKRNTLIKLHLYFSGLILVFLSFMALSGSLHLFTGDESEEVSLLKEIEISTELNKEELEGIFENELKTLKPNYSFDYIKGSNSSLTTRPTTRTYFTIKVDNGIAKIEVHNPSLNKSLMELHKGHGPKASRNILGILGVFAIFAVLSGLWLGMSSKAYRKITVTTLISGAIVYLLLFLL